MTASNMNTKMQTQMRDALLTASRNDCTLRISSPLGTATVCVQVSTRNDGHWAFSSSSLAGGKRKRTHDNSSHLRIKQNGRIDLDGYRNGPWTAFALAEADGEACLIHVKTGLYLGIQHTSGDFEAHSEPVPLHIELLEAVPEPNHVVAADMPAIDSAVLTPEDKQHFRTQGYIVLREAISPELVKEALRTINHKLGQPSQWEEDDKGRLKLPNSSCGQGGVDIVNRSPRFWSALNLLLGEGNVKPWRGQQGQQVALRFPQPPARGEQEDILPGTRYHIDGMDVNKLCPFSLLCGVALSDQSRPDMGNLHVFPGSHLHGGLHAYYKDGINDDDQGEEDQAKPDLGQSHQVLLRPGDVVLAHQLLAHRVGQNFSENIRYQLYYRVQHQAHRELKDRILDEPMIEFAV